MEGFNWSVLLWIAGLVFVYFFGIFEGRGQGRKRRIAEEEQEKKSNPLVPLSPVKVDDPGLLRIRNDNGTLTLDLDGQRVNTSALTGEQRKRLVEMLNAMRPWLENKPAPTPPAPVITPPPPPTPAPVSYAPPSPQPISAPSVSKPETRKENTKDEKEDPPPTSIVGQINLVLQARIVNTHLAAKGVSLTESPSGGVNVFVGVQRFEAIDDVPDEEVKAAIRAAIAEWEKKYTPGQ